MPKAYAVTLPDGITIQVIPQNPAQQALVTVDNHKILLTPDDEGFSAEVEEDGNSVVSSSSVEEIEIALGEQVAETELDSTLGRTCINCRGRRYCVTNACANTPCGWICG